MSARIQALANPQMLAWARRMAGLDLEEAAHKAGVKPERLTAWERGELRPTITQLRKLSDTYKRPLALFFLDRLPANEAAPRDFRRLDPDAGEPLSPALRLAIREARARREAALDLLSELDESPPEFRLAARLGDDPEQVGIRLREALAAGTTPPKGDSRAALNFWRTAAENRGVLVFQAEDVDVDEMRGFSLADRPLPAVVLNIKDAYAGRSFSLLHELAHILLNRGGLCVLEEGGPQTDIQRTEAFCNHVAGATLLPAELLLGEPEVPARGAHEIRDEAVSALARRYGASDEAVLRRLAILGRVPLEFYRQKRAEYGRRYAGLRQRPHEGGFAPPHVLAVATGGPYFTRLVLSAYDEERITASDLAEHLRVRLKHLDRIRSALRSGPIAGEAV